MSAMAMRMTEIKKFGTTLLLMLSLSMQFSGFALALDEPLNYERIAQDCVQQERYRTGGANIGDCYLDHAAALEAEIEDRLAKTAERFRDPEEGISFAVVRERIVETQRLWLAYRDAYCGFIEEFPGNTPSYVNAAGCVLGLTQDRLIALQFIEMTRMPLIFD